MDTLWIELGVGFLFCLTARLIYPCLELVRYHVVADVPAATNIYLQVKRLLAGLWELVGVWFSMTPKNPNRELLNLKKNSHCPDWRKLMIIGSTIEVLEQRTLTNGS